jgi:hypothetical protein
VLRLRRIADALRVSVVDLLEDDAPPNAQT